MSLGLFYPWSSSNHLVLFAVLVSQVSGSVLAELIVRGFVLFELELHVILIFTWDCPQSEREVTNCFASCELPCEECGEVLVANFKPIFPGENWRDILPPKNPPRISLAKFWIQISSPWTSGSAFAQSFLQESAQKSSRKTPSRILQRLYNKNPRHISAEGPGQKFRAGEATSKHPKEESAVVVSLFRRLQARSKRKGRPANDGLRVSYAASLSQTRRF